MNKKDSKSDFVPQEGIVGQLPPAKAGGLSFQFS